MVARSKPYGGIATISVKRSNDLVYQSLRKAISSGTLPPGRRLIEMQLADQLGVSRAPLREAVRVLEREGLITRLPRRGMIVAVLTRTDIAETYGLRTALECWAVRIACERITPVSLRKLENQVKAIETSSSAGNLGLLRDEDVLFHKTICELSGNRRLMDVWLSNLAQIQLLSAQSLDAMHSDLDLVPRRHQLIADAIAARDADLAETRVREHILTAAGRILEAMPDQPRVRE